uniref:Inositol polyphosphate-related phosphatase domain-containing protein n=1 Tax=Branchiostoma floridae TaxID=7739 RepID=C3ZKV0_BRAFL|eukprot:XP_002590840.1 hypothetical protein BRAFLDRAFT_90010 [Branchiostoma floridae]
MSDIGAETDSIGTGEEGSPATRKKHRQPKKKTLARLKAMKKNAMGSNESLGNSSQADSEKGNGNKEEEKGETKPDPKDSTSQKPEENKVENSEESKPKPKPRRRFKELVQSGDEADRNSLSDFEGKHSPRPPSKPKPPLRKFGSTDSLKSSSSVDVENKSQGLNLQKTTGSASSTDSGVARPLRPGQWRGPIEPKVAKTKPSTSSTDALSDHSSDEGNKTKKENRKDIEQKGREWEIRMQETLGPTHVLFYSGTYGVLHVCVFIRRDLIWFCSVAEEDTVSTRAFSQIKTKGGLAVSFNFFGTSFLFINSHFTSGDNKAKERIADYSKICEAINLPKVIPVNQHSTDPNDCTSRFDCVFWFGDMNFRLDHERSKVEELIKHGHKSDYRELVAHDQLTNFMKKEEAFVGFKENQIRFPPTYKFDLNTDHYDTSPKLRVPSYTDRVLYKCKKPGDVTALNYSNVPSIKISDHRPVYAVFEVKIRPGRDTIPLAAGQFDREVYIEANRRRAMQVNVERKQSRICSIM